MTVRWLIAMTALTAILASRPQALAESSNTIRALKDILSDVVLEKWNGQRLLFGDLRPQMIVTPEKDARVAARMASARREDVVVEGDDAMFSEDMIATGVWQAPFFLDTYGTALLLAEPWDDRRIPLVFVHGINGSPRDFANMAKHFADSPYQPLAFFYPSGMPLADASAQLAARLTEMVQRHRPDRFGIIGHSMGGLVAKGVLNQTVNKAVLPGWRTFVSIASPWAGIDAAQQAHQLPRHPASWDDLAPESAFINKIQRTPFPDALPFYIFFGARSGSRLMSALGNNDGVLTLASVLDSPLGSRARDVFGFYAEHTELLSDPLLLRRLDVVLATTLAPDGVSTDSQLPRR
jgi:pimeloyl-ACP methyl ester carboxylesterase